MLVRVKKRLRETASLQDLPRFLYFGNPRSVSGVSVREGGRGGRWRCVKGEGLEI